MAQHDREKWNQKYQHNPIPNEPIELVVEHTPLASKGMALDIACGMGRHSKYLVSQGFEVDALDISSVAIDSLANLPHIHAKMVDFDTDRLPRNRYSLIVCTFFLKRSLFPQIIEALQEGGVLIYETFVADLDNTFSPTDSSFLLEAGELEGYFSQHLEILHSQEYWGRLMRGEKSRKASLVARKPYAEVSSEIIPS